MNTIILVGHTGTGKSPVIRGLIDGKDCLVYDVQNEYGERTKYPNQNPMLLSDDVTSARARHTECDFDLFLDQAEQRKNSVVVFEDATAFVRGLVQKKLVRILTNKLFTGNLYVLVFHSIEDIPRGVMRISDYIVMFYTNDEEYRVAERYPRLLPYFKELQKNKTKSYKIKMS